MAPLRVLLVEDHTIVREGLRALVAGQPDLEVAAEAASGEEALELLGTTELDVAVVDLNLPGIDGVELIGRMARLAPNLGVVVLSMYGTAQHVRPAVRAGARGYIVKGAGLSDLLNAIRTVADGGAFFSPEVAHLVLADPGGRDAGVPDLTAREREVLRLVGEGLSSQEIADALGLSPKTVEGHRSRLIAKLGVKNVAGLVRHAVRLGLVPLDPA